jgi:sec-independent protein translocase protein TatA
MALGPWQLLIILAIVLLLFGGRGKISAIMGDFGKGLRNFKTGMKGPEEDAGEETDVLEGSPKASKKPAAKKATAKKATAKKATAKKATAKKAKKK